MPREKCRNTGVLSSSSVSELYELRRYNVLKAVDVSNRAESFPCKGEIQAAVTTRVEVLTTREEAAN
jgi:hypothetical protein